MIKKLNPKSRAKMPYIFPDSSNASTSAIQSSHPSV
ncbi:Uncharacterised protein [Segatella copri]|nr:Uncharacterised protein [Segatella copri]